MTWLRSNTVDFSSDMRLKVSNWRVMSRRALRPGQFFPNRDGAANRLGVQQDQPGVTADGLQQIIEIMRDAGGERADDLHFLRLEKLVLQLVVTVWSAMLQMRPRMFGPSIHGEIRISQWRPSGE